MADVARVAGVSVATVSRALSAEPGVRPHVRQRIEEIARALRYEVDASARSLRSRQNRTVSVVVPHSPDARESLTDPFFLSLIGSLADALTSHGYEMLLSRVAGAQVERLGRDFQSGRALGMVIIGQGHHQELLNDMADHGVPFVVWGAQMEGRRYATVGSDNELGGRLATEHLIDNGARRIAFLGDTSLPEVSHRYAGYLAAHRARGVLLDLSLTRPVPFIQDRVEQEVSRLIAQDAKLDAIFASSDVSALAVLNCLSRLGLRVPEDVQVIGYDDIARSWMISPALTSVGQSIELAGEALLRTLEAVLKGERTHTCVLPTALHVRESTRLVQGRTAAA